MKVWGIRSGMIGDMIMALPVLHWVEQMYPKSYKYWAIGQRFSQAAQLFINHPMIDKILILKTPEKLQNEEDIKIAKTCDLHFDITPQHPDGMPGVNCFWWNKYSLCEETFRMAGLPVSEYHKLPKEFKKPKLQKWFTTENHKKTIGIWPFAAYGKELHRSPSLQWWEELISQLIDINYKIHVFGHPNDPVIFENKNHNENIIYKRNLTFFDQIRASLECELCINTDSGSGWVLGAYGHNQISLLSRSAPNHYQNDLAFAPENWAGNNINIFNENSCSNIEHKDIIRILK